MAKKIYISLLAFMAISFIPPEVFKVFEGGRSFYSGQTLILYTNNGYKYHDWNHQGSHTSDTGQWKLIDTIIILKSIKTISKSSSAADSASLKFKDDTFSLVNDELFLFHLREIKDSDDKDYYYAYKTLHAVK